MIQYFEKLQIDLEFVSEISATFNVHEEDDEMFCISLGTLTNVDCMLTTKLLANHAAKHQITDIDESKNSSSINIENSSTENSDTENSSISYAYISEDDSFNDENPRISDVSDFFEHPTSPEANGEISEHLISPGANGEISKHSTSPETKGENSAHFFFSEANRLSISDDSAIQPIRRRRKRPRKHATEENFTSAFTSDINFFSNILINRHPVSNIPYVKSRKKEMIGSINSNAATRSAG